MDRFRKVFICYDRSASGNASIENLKQLLQKEDFEIEEDENSSQIKETSPKLLCDSSVFVLCASPQLKQNMRCKNLAQCALNLTFTRSKDPPAPRIVLLLPQENYTNTSSPDKIDGWLGRFESALHSKWLPGWNKKCLKAAVAIITQQLRTIKRDFLKAHPELMDPASRTSAFPSPTGRSLKFFPQSSNATGEMETAEAASSNIDDPTTAYIEAEPPYSEEVSNSSSQLPSEHSSPLKFHSIYEGGGPTSPEIARLSADLQDLRKIRSVPSPSASLESFGVPSRDLEANSTVQANAASTDGKSNRHSHSKELREDMVRLREEYQAQLAAIKQLNEHVAAEHRSIAEEKEFLSEQYELQLSELRSELSLMEKKQTMEDGEKRKLAEDLKAMTLQFQDTALKLEVATSDLDSLRRDRDEMVQEAANLRSQVKCLKDSLGELEAAKSRMALELCRQIEKLQSNNNQLSVASLPSLKATQSEENLLQDRINQLEIVKMELETELTARDNSILLLSNRCKEKEQQYELLKSDFSRFHDGSVGATEMWQENLDLHQKLRNLQIEYDKVVLLKSLFKRQSRNEIKELTEQLETKEREVYEMQSQIEQQEARFSELTQEIAALTLKLQQTEELLLASQETQFLVLRNELDAAKMNAERLNSERERLAAQLLESESRRSEFIQQTMTRNKEFEERLAAKTAEFEIQETNSRSLLDSIDCMKVELEQLRESKSQAVQQYEILLKERKEKENQSQRDAADAIDRLTSSLQVEKEKSSALNESVIAHLKDCQRLTEEVQTQEQLAKQSTEALEALKRLFCEKVESHTQSHQLQQAAIAGLEAELTAARKELARWEGVMQDAELRCKTAVDEKLSLVQEAETWKRTQAQLSHELMKAQRELQQLTEVNTSLRQSVSILDSENRQHVQSIRQSHGVQQRLMNILNEIVMDITEDTNKDKSRALLWEKCLLRASPASTLLQCVGSDKKKKVGEASHPPFINDGSRLFGSPRNFEGSNLEPETELFSTEQLWQEVEVAVHAVSHFLGEMRSRLRDLEMRLSHQSEEAAEAATMVEGPLLRAKVLSSNSNSWRRALLTGLISTYFGGVYGVILLMMIVAFSKDYTTY